MSNVVTLAPRKPAWLHFVAGRLMVGADRRLRDLHATAEAIGIPRRMFRAGSRRGGSLPYYELTRNMQNRCTLRFGPMATGSAAVNEAIDACYRKRQPPERQAMTR